MAAPMSEGDCPAHSDKSCFMCIFPVKKSPVIPFNDKTWPRFLEYVTKWKDLEGDQSEIARNYINIADNTAEFGCYHVDLTVCGIPIPVCAGFHQICYSRFTDKQRVERVNNSMQKKVQLAASIASTTEPAINMDETDDDSYQPPVKKRSLRSSTVFFRGKGKARSPHVLPSICVLCKEDKSMTCRLSRKRTKEKLSKCSIIEAHNLLQAAKDNNNTELLLQIQGKDCVAIEVQYHHTCYKNFTRYLSKPLTSQASTSVDTKYSEAYTIFCNTVKTNIIDNKDIYRLTRLNQMFIKQVKTTHNMDASTYKTGNLKTRLMKTFPQLCFLQPQMRSQGHLVYVNDISKAVLVEDRQLLHEVMYSSTDTETDTETATSNDERLPQPISHGQKTLPNTMKECNESYMTALNLRNTINDIKPNIPWPPFAEHLTVKAAENIIPPSLYNFIAWTVGVSDEPSLDNRVVVPLDTHRKILAISQDIVYLQSKGRKQMPKHMSLAMTVRHLTGSAQLIGLLNGFGYSVSTSVALNHDTAIANQEMSRGDNALPPEIQPGKHTVLIYDNNDFGEETLTGRGTTHNTNGIVVQRSSLDEEQQQVNRPTMKRTRERSVQPPPVDLAKYYGGKKEGPKAFGNAISLQSSTYAPLLKCPLKLDLAYNIIKFDIKESDRQLPAWTGFNQLLSAVNVPPKSVIGYLPIIDASPTEMDTVLTILQRSVQIADKLNLESITVVMDQAIYSKAQIIRWSNTQFMKRLVLRLGAFHTAMSFLGCIGKRFRDAGLQDILIESELVATGSINGVISGKHYNRAVRAHKLMAEAFQHMRLETYLQSISDSEAQLTRQLVTDMQKAFPKPEYNNLVDSERFQQFQTSYDNFLKANSHKQTFAFWSSYCDMVEILLLFLRGTREGNWELHLASVRRMLPWIFAYDHINYSRYLPVYWMEMVDLVNTHPSIHHKCMEGEFVVQRSDKAFSQIACDQTIEQTANRDSKTKGGMTGFTTSKGTVNRWIWSHHARGAITRECEAMAGKGERSQTRTDLLPSRMKHDRSDVLKIIETTNAMVNPFDYEEEELVHITSGVVASFDVQNDLRTARERGETELIKLCEQRVKKGEVGLFESMRKLKLNTFTNMGKTVKSKVRGKEVVLKADRNLLARLVVIGRYRKIDLQELLTYSLGPLPLPLASAHGGLVKTNKANLLHALESQPEKPVVEIPKGGVFIVDGMATIQQVNINKLQGQRTFLNLADVLLRRLVNRANDNSSKEVHFVTDTYRDMSIKNAERANRAVNGSQVMRIYGQALPQQWKKFLSNGSNKEFLIEFLFETWSKIKTSELKGVRVYLAHGSKCHMFSSGSGPDQKVQVNEVDNLNSTQEEADTRMYLHAAFAANTNAATDIIIISPDTDVFIIGISLQSVIGAKLHFHTGRGINLRTIDLKQIEQSIGNDVSKALIGLHCLTGCDSVSAFYGKGKKRALNLLLKDNELCPAFKDLGERFDIDPDMVISLEKFVCKLYGQKDVETVNEARYNMFRLARKSEIAMPPNQDSLTQHIKRANYQAAIYKRSLQPNAVIPLPDGHGWKTDSNGELIIDWMNRPSAPESIMQLANCTASCKKSGCNDATKCTCLENSIPCTDLCKCARLNCSNVGGQHEIEDDDTEYEESDDEED